MTNNFLSQIRGAGNTERSLRAYAYLKASFLTSKQSDKPIDDVFDCILPFLIEGMSKQVGQQLNISELQTFLKDNFDFSIPVYVIEHILPRIRDIGAIEWNDALSVYICLDIEHNDSQKVLDRDIISGTDFIGLEYALKEFSSYLNSPEPEASNNWSEALIQFLKSESALTYETPKGIRGAEISSPSDLENFVVARFIQSSQENDPHIFSIITKIYTGVLIEDFIQTIQEIGVDDEYSHLTVYYDTSIILRLLGSSGEVYKNANLEMHRTIEQLGSKTMYFDHTESEVVNILDTIMSNYNIGNRLFGETAEAMLRGEVTIETVKDLSATFSERLALLNIFKSRYAYENTTTANYYQIDEVQFERFLASQAAEGGRRYSQQNLNNDAKTLALTMRLRHGARFRDVAKCKHVFVSSNKLLVRSARSFVADHEKFGWRNSPPLLTVGQMSTLAWLVNAHELDERKVSTELLANCYGAVQPDPDWTPEFLKALTQFKEESEDVSVAESAVFMHSARRIAQDQSFANSVILKQLDTLEIFGRAEKEFLSQQENTRKETNRREKDALEKGLRKGRDNQISRQNQRINSRADQWSNNIVRIMQYAIIIFAAITLLASDRMFSTQSLIVVAGQVIIFILASFQIVDLVGFPLVRTFLDKWRNLLADRFRSFFDVT